MDVQFLVHNHKVIPARCMPSEKFTPSWKPRGGVGGFSKMSKRRLSQLVFSFKKLPFVSFWTLTFRNDVKSEFAKAELNRFCNYLRKSHIGYLWVMEFTEKKRIHFHMGMTDMVTAKKIRKYWKNGFVYRSKIYEDKKIRWYFLKEIAKGNQKRFCGFNGRWWGVCRVLNKKFSLGIYDESYLQCLIGERGFKRNYWREDLENILDNPYLNSDNFQEVKSAQLEKLKCLKQKTY